ncbi:MAG: pseudouridine-5'-phosphate glycosidase [Dehalococcoidia bacterium]|nr:pseudouridine-5'-phosphate glycosidase [Dehalococcoidia bacterium]
MPGRDLPEFIHVSSEIREALSTATPVVALESAVISHGFPHPTGLDTAAALEAEVRAHGAVPATIAVTEGRLLVGAKADELARLTGPEAWKIAERDLPGAVAMRATGGTTVSATIAIAQRAGIDVLSTGGIGGVHLGAEHTWDVSADLPALARHSIIVVCAGAKAICDIAKTLEYLDTAGVTVAAFGTDRFPNFYAVDSGLTAPRRIDEPRDAAVILGAKRRLRQPGAVLVANPIPEAEALSSELVAAAVAQAAARTHNVRGGDITPALLSALSDITGGRTLRANLALLRANARLASLIAREAAQESLRG